MGDPRKIRKKYQTPSHPWQKERIEEEKVLSKEYGLKNKKEIWKVYSLLRTFLKLAKKLSASSGSQAEKEKKQLLDKLHRLGLIEKTAGLEDALDLKVKDLMERRLQTLLVRKGLARSIKQARQFIIHKHIMVDKKKMSVPSYIVRRDEENMISFSAGSKLAADDHPERKKKEEAKAAHGPHKGAELKKEEKRRKPKRREYGKEKTGSANDGKKEKVRKDDKKPGES